MKMRFDFEVGIQEKHQVEVRYNNWVGKLNITVDGKLVKKDLKVFYWNIIGIILFVLILIDLLTNRYFYAVLSIILFFYIITMLYLEKQRSLELIIGEQETHNVIIEMSRPWLTSRTYLVMIDGELTHTFQGR